MSQTDSGPARSTIILYGCVTFLFWLSLYIYVPTLPSYVQSKSSSLTMVGLVLSMYGLWMIIVRVPLGVTADWLGRGKPFIIGGVALAGLGAWIMGIAEGPAWLMVGRSLTGIGIAAWVPLLVTFNNLFPPQEAIRATAILTTINSVGRVLATGVTGSLNEWGGYSVAFFVATGAAGLAVVLLIPIPERAKPGRKPSLDSTVALITRRDVLLPALLAAVFQYVNWTTGYGFHPLLVKQFGGTDVTQSMLVSMHVGLVVLGNFTAATIVDRIGPRRLVYISLSLISLGTGLAALSASLPLLFAGQFCLGLAIGISYPVLMGLSIRFVADTGRNTAMGVNQAVYAIGIFFGPWISGFLADRLGIQPMLGITAVGCLGVGLVIIQQMDDNH